MPLDNQVSYRLEERHARFLENIGAPVSNWNDAAKTVSIRGACRRIHGGRSDDGITAAGLFHDHLNKMQFAQHLA